MPQPPPPEPEVVEDLAAPVIGEEAGLAESAEPRTFHEQKADEKKADEANKTVLEVNGNKVDLKMGCYLVHDDVHQGTFYTQWSKTAVMVSSSERQPY
jgi:hypothetical protein